MVGGHVEGLYLGEPAEVDRFGLADPRLRLAVNLYGAPAMTPQAFASYQQGTIVGVSLTVAPPLGQYDPTKLINLGTNRWSFKPEVGFSRTLGKWVVEAMAGVWLFTDNTDFFGGRTRQQDPIVATQLHLTYKFTRTMWLAGDANYFTGGRTTIGGRQNLDLQRNSRIGATFSAALGSRPGDSYVGEPRRVHHHRRRLHVDRLSATTTRGRVRPTQCDSSRHSPMANTDMHTDVRRSRG